MSLPLQILSVSSKCLREENVRFVAEGNRDRETSFPQDRAGGAW